jgi:DtxR family transcriptional regulator, Mn-dependent transcriptional regulator
MATKADQRIRLTAAQQDYLKAIYQLARGGDRKVATSELARRLRISAAAVTEMLGKLAGLDLVFHDRYHGASLTARGRRVALEVLRHHRLVEMYLTRFLGYRWDEVHDEADQLEHVISERMESRMFEALGRPNEDPHGDPIPSLDGKLVRTDYRSLMACEAGERVTVRRVSDLEAGKLRALAAMGVELGTRIQILEQSLYEGPIAIRLKRRRVDIPIGLARVVYVG